MPGFRVSLEGTKEFEGCSMGVCMCVRGFVVSVTTANSAWSRIRSNSNRVWKQVANKEVSMAQVMGKSHEKPTNNFPTVGLMIGSESIIQRRDQMQLYYVYSDL